MAFVMSILVMLFSHLLFKYIMPKSYNKYKAWNNTSIYITRITILPLAGYLLFFASGFNYLNQYQVTSPIEIIKTLVINKRTAYRNTKENYTDIYISSEQILTLNSDNLYNMINIGDEVTVKIQKGRLGEYFALELKVQKNNYVFPL